MEKSSSISIKDFEKLRDSVNQSSEHAKRQLETITNPILLGAIGGVISLILALGLSYILKIFVYWIPSSFILMYLWALGSNKSARKPLRDEEIDKSLKIYQKTDPEVFNHVAGCFIKNISSLIYSTGIIFIISFFIILSIINDWISIGTNFPYFFPLITCLFYLPVPFLMGRFLRFFQKGQYKTFLDKVTQTRSRSTKKGKYALMIAKIIVLVMYGLIVVLLPLISIIYLLPVIEDFLLLILVLIIQTVLIILFSSYFSGIFVRMELGNTITNYSDINNHLSRIIIEGSDDVNQYNLLKKLYYTAKPYDFKIDDSFKIVNFYFLLPNRVYLKELSRDEKT